MKREARIDNKVQWMPSQKDLFFSPDGKHNLHFAEDFPFLIKALSFSIEHHLTPSYHDYLEIFCVFKGKGVFRIEEKEYSVEEGDILVIGTDEFHVLEANSNQSLKVIVIYFLPELIHNPGDSDLNFQYLRPFYDHSVEYDHKIPYGCVENRRIFNIMKSILKEMQKKPDYFKLGVKNHLCQILLILLQFYGRLGNNLRIYQQRKANIDRLRNVFSFVRKNYSEKITLKQIAKVASMSPSYLCKFFKKTTGHTITEYILRVRIDRAKELLLQTNLSITEIGLDVGFENHSYFDRAFKRLTGVSPMEFRRMIENL